MAKNASLPLPSLAYLPYNKTSFAKKTKSNILLGRLGLPWSQQKEKAPWVEEPKAQNRRAQ